MTVSPEMEVKIRRLFFGEHWRRGTIATQLGVHVDVVNRVVGQLGSTPGTKTVPASKLEPFKSFIDDKLQEYPKLISTRIYDMIRGRGYEGSIGTLRRYVRISRPVRRKQFLDIETMPGEIGEVDWGHVGELSVPGGHRPLWIFVMVLPYSRMAFVELVLSLDAGSLRRSLLRASEFFGGSPRAWLFDNAKTVVVERRGRDVRFHRGLLELAGQLHVEPRVCDPHAPHQKGAVERFIRYIKGRFFAARTIRSIPDGNKQLRNFLNETAAARPHPRQAGNTVGEVYVEEQQKLLPLPDPTPTLEVVKPVTVDAKGFVQLDTNRYSVPTEFARGSLVMSTTDTSVRLINGSVEVARHERSWGFKQTLECPHHRAQLLANRKQARRLKGRDRLTAEVPAIEPLLGRWLDQEFKISTLVGRTTKLLDDYGPPVLRLAVNDMNKRALVDFGALVVLCEGHRKNQGDAIPQIIELAPHVDERDVVPHDLGDYDDE